MRTPDIADENAHRVVFRREVFLDALDEYRTFVSVYWNNSPENSREEPLDFDWDLYRSLDGLGMLHLVVGRDGRRMVAAALYLIQRDLKRKYRTVALCDTFAVDLAWRRRGIGRRMMAYVEQSLKSTDASVIMNGYRMVYNTVPLFESLGFTLFEKYYIKDIVRDGVA